MPDGDGAVAEVHLRGGCTPVIKSPTARVATSSVPLMTYAIPAFRWYLSIVRLAAATTSAPSPCLGIEPFWATVAPLVEPPEGSREPGVPPLARSLLPPQHVRAKDATAAVPAPINFKACLRDTVPSASPLADVSRGELAVGASLPKEIPRKVTKILFVSLNHINEKLTAATREGPAASPNLLGEDRSMFFGEGGDGTPRSAGHLGYGLGDEARGSVAHQPVECDQKSANGAGNPFSTMSS
jgi:hypothetical protein